MKRLRAILIFLIFCSASNGQDLKHFADSILLADNIPAIDYAVFKSDTVFEMDAVGLNRIDRKERVNLNSRFHLGSNSKAITAFIAAKLVEEGKLKWETLFFELYPELATGADTSYLKITLADLLSHRARIKPFTAGEEFLELKLTGDQEAQKMQFAKFLLHHEPQKFKKDEAYIYSNAGYALAAMMLERATGKSYKNLVNEIMNEQLKLNVQFGWPNIPDATQPSGHIGKSWGQEAMKPLTDSTDYKLNTLIIPAGDLNMTLPDYTKFIQLILKGIKGENNFLRSETYEHLLFGLPEYAFGWGNGLKEKKYFASHDGSAGTFYCHTLILKKSDLAIIVVSNSAEENTVKGIYALRNLILKKYKK